MMTPAPANNDHEKPSSIPWPPLLLVILVIAAIVLGRMLPIPWPGLDDTPARIAGWAICGVGLALAVWALFTLRRHNTTVRPDEAASELVTNGPFAWRRNPIYLGDFLILIGVCVLTTNLWFGIAAVAFIPLVTWLAILPEERHLEARFGDEWRTYSDRTRRLF